MFAAVPTDLRLLDFILMVLLLVALPAWDHFIDIPKMRKSVEAGTFNPTHGYLRTFIILWSLVLFLAVDWWTAGRDPKILGLAVNLDLRFLLGCLFTIAVIVFFSWEYFRVRGLSDERKHKIAEKNARIFEVAPSDSRQLLYSVGVSVTAGVTEELLCRGFLIWSFAAYMNPILAAVLSSLLFGLGHFYQGIPGIAKTGGVGLVMALLYIGSGTILLPIILHAFVDVHNCLLIYSLKSTLAGSQLPSSAERRGGG